MLGSWMDSHLIISSCAHSKFLHPGSGRFCPLNSQKHVTVPAPGSKFDASGFPKPKRRTCDRIGQERVSTLPESIRLIAADGSKVATRPHLVPERRGYSFNISVAPRCETHMRFKPYTFSYVFIIIAYYSMRE